MDIKKALKIFKLSDLLFVIGFIPLAIFLIFGQLFMQATDPDVVALKLWMIIPLFAILLVSWLSYIYLESKAHNTPPALVSWVFIFMAIIGVIGVLAQPSFHSVDMVKMAYEAGDIFHIEFDISPTHVIFFTFDIISILLLIYIGLFILPKRFTNFAFVRYLIYGVIALGFAVVLYSYIFESANYIPFVKAFFSGRMSPEMDDSTYTYAVKSFVIHRNAYGMIMLIVILCCCINQSIEGKWYYYPLAVFFYINMIFSFCKTSLFIGLVVMFIYFVFKLIYTFRPHPKRNKIVLMVFGGFCIVILACVFISIFTEGKFLSPIYYAIEAVKDGETINARYYIWVNAYQLINQNSLLYVLIGRGFGLINLMILPMNIANGDGPLAFPTHSSYVNLLAEGGIFFLLGYLLLLALYVYTFVKCVKKQPSLAVAIAMAVFSFTLYSLIETIHYIVYVFMFLGFVQYHILYGKKEETIN